MKCRKKSSGEIVDVINWSIDGAYTNYIDKDGCEVSSLLNYYKDFEPIVEDNIDWEQRRYEIAKDISCAYLQAHSNIPFDDISKVSIEFSDKLIKQLKEKQNEI